MHHLEQAMPLRRSTPSVVNLSHHVFVQKTHWSYRRCSCVFAHFTRGCWSYVTARANFVWFNYRQHCLCAPKHKTYMWSFLVMKTNCKMLGKFSSLWLRPWEVVEYRVQNYRYDYLACYVLCPQSMNIFFQTTPLSRLFSCNAWRKRRIKTYTCIFRVEFIIVRRMVCWRNIS